MRRVRTLDKANDKYCVGNEQIKNNERTLTNTDLRMHFVNIVSSFFLFQHTETNTMLNIVLSHAYYIIQ